MKAVAPGDRVVITGVGLVTTLGSDRESTWHALTRGESGATWLDPETFGPALAGFPVHRGGQKFEGLDPALAILARASDEALADAGLSAGDRPYHADRSAALIGLSKGAVRNLSSVHRGTRLGHPVPGLDLARTWLQSWPGAGAAFVAGRHGFRGAVLGPVAACATGLVAVLQGVDLIRWGACDVALVGGADASLEPLVVASFRRMKVLARVGADPRAAVRPWDAGRSGFLVGEGGAVLVLERLDRARDRGATPLAEVAGGALGSDAFHETALDPDPRGLARLITRALADAGSAPSEIDAVNVHGTATPGNDPLECRALRLALGPAADRVLCTASKPQIGHLLGAAGSVELAITALGVARGVVPPTLNLDDPDPACDLGTVPGSARTWPTRAALKLSLGFGGHLAAAVLRRVDPD